MQNGGNQILSGHVQLANSYFGEIFPFFLQSDAPQLAFLLGGQVMPALFQVLIKFGQTDRQTDVAGKLAHAAGAVRVRVFYVVAKSQKLFFVPSPLFTVH